MIIVIQKMIIEFSNVLDDLTTIKYHLPTVQATSSLAHPNPVQKELLDAGQR